MDNVLVKGDTNRPEAWRCNKIINANYRLTIQEQRLIYILTSQIKNDDDDLKEYEFHVADIANKLGLNKKSQYRHMQEITGSLVGRRIIIHEKDGPLQVAWLNSAKYYDKQGKVSLGFSPRLKPYLLQLKGEFTKLNLENVIHLNSIYSMRIYEMLSQYKRTAHRTREIRLEEIKEMLQITQKSYHIYNNFKQKILLVAEKELRENDKSDIYFTFDEIKESRKVVAIKFYIHFKNKEEQLTLQREAAQEEQLPEASEIVIALLQEGVTPKRAMQLVDSYTKKQIQANIELYRQQKDKGPGYLIKAIEEDFAKALTEQAATRENESSKADQEARDKFKDFYLS